MPKTYNLELTPEEMATLAILLNKVGGDPDTSLRKFTDSIRKKSEVRAKYEVSVKAAHYLANQIHFEDDFLRNPLFTNFVRAIS